ncbi:MAG TPA: RDD family protein [Tepidisphaeraceae bacterium]|nr:RDD family protein [Tepidisphaeraceae bacterium]
MGQGEWFYISNNAPAGPVSLDELAGLFASRQLNPSSLVWHADLPDWVTAVLVPELRHAIVPPPVVSAEPIPYFTPQIDQRPIRFAGFWIRLVAYVIDSIVVEIAVAIMGEVMGIATSVQPITLQTGPSAIHLHPEGVIGFLMGWLYFSLMESSSRQATLGKLAVGIKVTDLHGQRISFGRATGRYFAKFLSQIIFAIGYIMAGLTQRKQALHDFVASTLVSYR